MTVAELRTLLEECDDNDVVVVAATLGDGSVIYVTELNVGTRQGGPGGEGCEVVIDWEPGAEGLMRP